MEASINFINTQNAARLMSGGNSLNIQREKNS